MERLSHVIEEELRSKSGLYVVGLDEYREEIVRTIMSAKLDPSYVEYGGDWITYWQDGQMVGCVTSEKRGSLVHLQSLSVNPMFRRKGIAREMVQYVFDNYLEPGEILTALTLFWNIKIYRKMGFHTVDAAEMKKMDDVAGREKHKHCAALVRVKEY